MRRVLFVDDESRILEGLQRLLRPQRTQWEMVFAPGGEAALAALETTRFDVIVSDIRMPGMDGPQLLRKVRKRFPSIVRIVLSGHTDLEGALRSVAVAHQFLAKPCDTDMLKAVVERACELRASFTSEGLRSRIGALGTVPSRPRIYEELKRALADQEVPVGALARIIERDVAMCAKLLQLLNSAFFFGLPRRSLTNVETAIGYLGTSMLRRLVFSVEIFEPFDDTTDAALASFEALERHAIVTARLAARLLPDPRQAHDAFMAGMLHDIGTIAMAASARASHRQGTARSCANGQPGSASEEVGNGVTNAQIGAYLLGLWGLPVSVADAVEHYQRPATSDAPGMNVRAAIHIAHHLARESAAGAPSKSDVEEEPLNVGYLKALGVAGELPAWRRAAREMAATAEEA